MIICAALEVQVEGLPYTTIIPCWRHGKGYEILRDLGYAPRTKYKVLREGFMDNKGEFLDRKEAFKHVNETGQCNATQRYYWEDHRQEELYSEDLY